MRRLARFAIACILSCLAAHAQQSWTLDSGTIRKTINFTPEHGLEVTNWSDQTSNFNFVSPEFLHRGYNEFQFTADEKNVSGKPVDVSFTGDHAERTTDGTEHLDLTFASKRVSLSVTVHYELAKDSPAVRQYLSITNTSAAPIVLRHMTVAAAAIAPGPERDLIAFGGYGEEPRETYFTGRVNDVAVLLENAKTGVGFAVLSEVPGYLKRIELEAVMAFEPMQRLMYLSSVVDD